MKKRTLILIGIIVVLVAAVSCQTRERISPHFTSAIDYSNQATRILNKGNSPAVIDPKEMRLVIDLMKRALEEAMLVDTSELNKAYTGFGDHFKNEFIEGLRLFIEGYETSDGRKALSGQMLDDRWGAWYMQNIDAIRARS